MSDMHAETAPFMRDNMLEARPAPGGALGPVKWVQDNLFSSWLNAVLTILGLLAIYWLVAASLPWFLHSVWVANSLGECRAIIQGEWGPGADGACWAVIRERWHQFLFGFYPDNLFWRPTLALGLMFAALAPVLFSGSRRNMTIMVVGAGVLTLVAVILLQGIGPRVAVVAVAFAIAIALALAGPGRLILLTVLYPFIGYYLLWGGNAWAPIGVIAGFAIMVLVYRYAVGFLGVVVASAVGFLVACVWWLFLQGLITPDLGRLIPLRIEGVESDRFGGFLLSIVIGVTAISASLPMGILLALGRRSDMLLIKALCVGFIEFIRGVPLITMLFTASLLLQYFLPPQTQFDLILRVVILVTFFAAAYIAEVIRGGLASLPRGQFEAGDALGLDYWQAQRLIVMPQALKIAIPGIVGSFIGLFKDTTLVAFVGLADPLIGVTKIVRADINWKGIYWEPYLFVGAIFFVFCFGMSRYSMYLERRLKTDHR